MDRSRAFGVRAARTRQTTAQSTCTAASLDQPNFCPSALRVKNLGPRSTFSCGDSDARGLAQDMLGAGLAITADVDSALIPTWGEPGVRSAKSQCTQ
jgi:hypothetical protein